MTGLLLPCALLSASLFSLHEEPKAADNPSCQHRIFCSAIEITFFLISARYRYIKESKYFAFAVIRATLTNETLSFHFCLLSFLSFHVKMHRGGMRHKKSFYQSPRPLFLMQRNDENQAIEQLSMHLFPGMLALAESNCCVLKIWQRPRS